ELAIEIRREVEARCEEADQLRCRAIERAQFEADLAQRLAIAFSITPSRCVTSTRKGEFWITTASGPCKGATVSVPPSAAMKTPDPMFSPLGNSWKTCTGHSRRFALANLPSRRVPGRP